MIWILIFVFFLSADDDVCNRIMIDKFFRGIVADNLYEDKNLLSETECLYDTYSQIRSCLILWIEKNPLKACELFKKNTYDKGGFSIRTTIYEYYLNPRFKELIDKMEYASKKNISSEEIRELSSILFDAVGKYDKSEREKSLPALDDGKNVDINDYFSINTKALNDEILRLEEASNHLSSYKVKDLNGIIKSADEFYIRFISYASTIKNIKGVNSYHLQKIISQITELKKYLILKAAIIKLRLTEKEFIDAGFENIYKDLEKEIIYIYSNQKSFSDFTDNISVLIKKIEDIYRVASFMLENKRISNLLNIRYICLIDYLFSLINNKLLALKFYNQLERDINYLKDYFSNISSSSLNETEYKQNIEKSNFIISEIYGISKKHRFLQYIVWDNLIPYDIYFNKEKKYLGIKIREEILFNNSNNQSIGSWYYSP